VIAVAGCSASVTLLVRDGTATAELPLAKSSTTETDMLMKSCGDSVGTSVTVLV
jgi:hypothetical protein